MRETLKEWRDEWITTNGKTSKTSKHEVIIEDRSMGDVYIYEGNFAGIPVEFFERKVIENGKILDSSVPERRGAYLLTIKGED